MWQHSIILIIHPTRDGVQCSTRVRPLRVGPLLHLRLFLFRSALSITGAL
jgi:hypothetical protein